VPFLISTIVRMAAAQDSGAVAHSESTTASMQPMIIPSHGSKLLGVLYLAAGSEPHPTAVIFHGFPGFEQNLDLAQSLRSHGWNVLVMHYRGSWGVGGRFSFEHAAEDADVEVRYTLGPVTADKYRVDTRRVVVIGHSMGGYMAASAMAHNPRVAAAVLISAWNIGADYESGEHLGPGESPTVQNEAKGLGRNGNILPLAGTSARALAREIFMHENTLNFINLAPAISPRPVLIINAKEGFDPSARALMGALLKMGDVRVAEQHWETDHSYSDKRQELSDAILEWTKHNLPS
jgi:pimeloyl-ACP methyl ester carboxylesterase